MICSGWNDSQQAYQEALATYRQLAQDNSQAYLPYVATILNNLAVLYRATQRPSDSEQAYQEALAAYRQLTQDNPQAYVPYVATILSNLGFLNYNQGNSKQAHAYVDEALTIRRRLWEKHASVYGNDLAQSLGVEVLILLSTNGGASLVCDRLQEMANVALSENLKRVG